MHCRQRALYHSDPAAIQEGGIQVLGLPGRLDYTPSFVTGCNAIEYHRLLAPREFVCITRVTQHL